MAETDEAKDEKGSKAMTIDEVYEKADQHDLDPLHTRTAIEMGKRDAERQRKQREAADKKS